MLTSTEMLRGDVAGNEIPFFDSWLISSYPRGVWKLDSYPQLNKIMKKHIWMPAVAISLCLVACDAAKTTKEKMDAGADKMAAGAKEMATAASDKAGAVQGDAKAAIDQLGDKAKAAAADAKASVDAAAADAKAKVEAGVAEATDKLKDTAAEAAKAAEEAAAKMKEELK